MTSRTSRFALAAVCGASLALAGCSGGSTTSATAPSGSVSGSGSAGGSSSAGVPASTPPTEALSKFYSQKLAWKDCNGVTCAKLTVPVDYANPGGATIQLAVSKYAAKGTSRGSIVYNPGGPGASGYDYAADALTPGLAQSYDSVGFDPRGVGRSAPITCVSDADLDAFIGADPTPDDKAEEVTAQQNAKTFAQKCKAKAGPLLGHVSTVEVAKDMDVLRAALGEDKLNYLGMSYGTFIGSTYAGLFPKRVGRFVLDGVVPPDVSSTQMNLGQAQGFEGATRSYVQNCVDQGGCYLGATVDAGMAKIRAFLKQLDAKPLPISGQGDVTQFTEGWASTGLALGFYSKQLWPQLTTALKAAMAGNPDQLMGMANLYSDRSADGSYANNSMQAFYAVSCLDRGASSDLSSYERDSASFSKQAPTWGPMLAWGSLVCGEWSMPATGKAEKISAAGSQPILVVGTTRDPATPYRFSQQLAKELSNARLLTFNGDGHTAYGQSECVNSAVDDYFGAGTLPAVGKTC
ncbi:alpha/beta hydrolase [Calidifontibacter terrae]